jgi:hypothetical protein
MMDVVVLNIDSVNQDFSFFGIIES